MNTSSLANCRTVVVLNPEKFRSDFFDWITKNYEIFLRFEIEANKIRAAGSLHTLENAKVICPNCHREEHEKCAI